MSYHAHLRYHRVSSKVLRGNPMGNSPERALATLLPETLEAGRKYPVIWMLDGYLGNGFSMLSDPGALGSSLCAQLLRYQSDGVLPPCIFVFPDPSTLLGGSQYLDSPACGPFLTHLVEELVPFVDATLPTIAHPGARVLAGHSSGGYGALMIPMLRPGVFGHAIASAADSAFEHSMVPSFANAAARLRKAGSAQAFVSALFALSRPEKCSKEDFHTLMTLAMASCYSPLSDEIALRDQRNGPHFARLPFDLETLDLIPDVWAEWISHDPVEVVTQKGAVLRQLHHLHLDAGSEDEFCAQFGHRKISRTLNELNVPHLITEFQGGHSGTSFRWEERFKILAEPLRRYANLS